MPVTTGRVWTPPRARPGPGGDFITWVGVRNATGVVANFHAAQREVPDAVRVVIRTAARAHRKLAQSLAPYRTGRLKRSITSRLSEQGLAYTVFPDPEVFRREGQPPYFIFQEFGTIKMAAQPYLLPSYRTMAPIVRRDTAAAVRRSVNSMRGRRAA